MNKAPPPFQPHTRARACTGQRAAHLPQHGHHDLVEGLFQAAGAHLLIEQAAGFVLVAGEQALVQPVRRRQHRAVAEQRAWFDEFWAAADVEVTDDSAGASDTTTSRPVRRTESATGPRSSGDSDRRSTTSSSRPSSAAAAAASRQVRTIGP